MRTGNMTNTMVPVRLGTIIDSFPGRASRGRLPKTYEPRAIARAGLVALLRPSNRAAYCTALIMSKIGRYIATTMPPTITPRNTIMIGSMRLNKPLTAVSTSVS